MSKRDATNGQTGVDEPPMFALLKKLSSKLGPCSFWWKSAH